MLQEVETSPRTVDVNVNMGHEYASVQEMVEAARSLGCQAVVNCVGLGAASVCNDPHLMGARGILLEFDRKTTKRTFVGSDGTQENLAHDAVILVEERPWADDLYPCYLIPRGDRLVVGGSYAENDKEPTIRPEERDRLLTYASHLGIDAQSSPPVGEWTGFRPYRRVTRCEVDNLHGGPEAVKVVHNYGHGGSGWTVAAGVAREAAALLEIT